MTCGITNELHVSSTSRLCFFSSSLHFCPLLSLTLSAWALTNSSSFNSGINPNTYSRRNKGAHYEEEVSVRPRGDRQNETDAVITTSPAESLPVISDSDKLPAGVSTLQTSPTSHATRTEPHAWKKRSVLGN
ncbi:uncharacterized [Tachysurus ichikawai]